MEDNGNRQRKGDKKIGVRRRDKRNGVRKRDKRNSENVRQIRDKRISEERQERWGEIRETECVRETRETVRM